MSCPCCQLMGHSCNHPVHIESPLPNREHRCRCQAVTIVTEPFSSLGKESDQRRVSPSQCWELKSRSFPDTLHLVLGRVFCFWCCYVKAPRNPLAARNHVACSSSKPERAEHWNVLNKFCHAERTNFCPSSMSRRCCQLMGHSCSHQVHIESPLSNREHRFRCQTVTIVRELFSSLGKGSGQWIVSPSQCWGLKSRSFPDTLNLVLGRVFCFPSRPVLPFCPFWLHTFICLNSPELHCWLSSHPYSIKMLGLCFRVYVRRSQGARTDPAKDSMPRACRRGQGLPSDLPKDSLCLHLVVIDCKFVVRKVFGMTLPKTACPGHAIVS